MASSREVYEDWLPILEWEEDARAFDYPQFLESFLIVQKGNGTAGESVGGPRDIGYDEPLTKKVYTNLPDDMDTTATYDLGW
jgi:hypothetical protein